MKPHLEKIVQHFLRVGLRQLSPDYDGEDGSEPPAGVPAYITRKEAAEVEAEITRRTYVVFDAAFARPRLASLLPYLTGAQLDLVERELQRALAPLGPRPGLN